MRTAPRVEPEVAGDHAAGLARAAERRRHIDAGIVAGRPAARSAETTAPCLTDHVGRSLTGAGRGRP